MPHTSWLKEKYLLMFTDDKSGFTWDYYLKDRSNLDTKVRDVTELINTQHEVKVKRIYCDNEFVTNAI